MRKTSSDRAYSRAFHLLALSGAFATIAGLQACGGGDDAPPPPAPAPPPAPVALACDDTMKTAFKPDANTSVTLVKAFKAGDQIALSGTTVTPSTPTAAKDLCFVKLLVGPGNPGAASAPSTSPGIGIEVWLPTTANWNKKIHNLGGGGWAGGNHTSLTVFGNAGAAATAGTENSVVGTTDTGHTVGNGSFAMNADGSIGSALWKDFAERSLHELAVKTKALTSAYYLETQKYAYWDGCSTGGRQGYNVAQNHPTDYNGYLNGAPAFNWTKFITNELYPQIVFQRDLGGVALTTAQQNLVGGAAVSACDVVGGQHLGYVTDPQQCRYDPTKDASVLCTGVTIGAVTGTNATAACVNAAQATAANKIWYGQTADGSVPDPAVDNATLPTLASKQVWWGLTRGSNLSGLAGAAPFSISSDMVALELQDATYATPSFTNAIANGANRWMTLSYAELANASAQGDALQSFFGNINTDNPDLSGVRDSGAKILHYHGLADTLITPMGSINYYTRMSNLMGGYVAAQQFNRMFLVPGMGHCAGIGSVNGLAGPANSANSVPLPATGQLFAALVDWVENGNAPSSIVLNSANSSASQPVCTYPKKATYNGTGPVTTAASYTCR